MAASNTTDVQATVSPSQICPDAGNESTVTVTVSYTITLQKMPLGQTIPGSWYVQVNRKSDPPGAAPLNSYYLKKMIPASEKTSDGNSITGSWTIESVWLPKLSSNYVVPDNYEFRFYGPWASDLLYSNNVVTQGIFYKALGFTVLPWSAPQATGPATVSVQPTALQPGNTISITWGDPAYNSDDPPPMVISPSNTSVSTSSMYKIVTNDPGGQSGTRGYALPATMPQGIYYIVLTNDSYNSVLAASNAFMVTAGTPTTTGTSGTTSTLQLTATGCSQSVTLNWTAPPYGKTVTGYYPYRGTTKGGEASDPLTDFPVTGSSFTDQNVQNGITYYYILKPVFSDKSQGTASNEASATLGASPNTSTNTNSTTGTGTIVLQVGSATMTVNGSSQTIDAPPELNPKYSRVFLPIRALIEAMGGSVAWDSDSQQVTVTLGVTKIVLTINSSDATVNGNSVTMDVNPYISSSGRTMLPLRFITENLGCQVGWDGPSQSVTINYTPSPGSTGGGALPGNLIGGPGVGLHPTLPGLLNPTLPLH
jgi:hypothetical protein